MKKICPNHVKEYLIELSEKNIFTNESFEEYDRAYIINCSCGHDSFKVELSNVLSVRIMCEKCNKYVVIYDLDNYTCSEKLDWEETFEQYVSIYADVYMKLCAVYEYSDDFSLDDIRFDCNDITWFQLLGYGEMSKKAYEIFNHETA